VVSTGTEASNRQEPVVARRLADPLPGREATARRALRILVTQLGLRPPSHGDEEIAFRAEIDGTRYTLIRQRAPEAKRAVALSAREQEIARLISAGHTNKTVAAVLDISLWTVDTHIRRIFAKLGVRSRSAMVAQLAELGLLTGVTEPRLSSH
jgi:DNA-binding CsgD family transcriptional regulator